MTSKARDRAATPDPGGQSGAMGRGTSSPATRHLDALDDAELLGLLLGGGRTYHHSAVLARRLLAESGGLAALPGAAPTLLRHHGLGERQVTALLAACELACRIVRQRIPERRPLDRPERHGGAFDSHALPPPPPCRAPRRCPLSVPRAIRPMRPIRPTRAMRALTASRPADRPGPAAGHPAGESPTVCVQRVGFLSKRED
jgi:hypothetical protein